MNVVELLISVAGSATITGVFGYAMKRKDSQTSQSSTRATAEADAYIRAQKIYEGALTALERENAAQAAEISYLKDKTDRRKS